MVAADAGVVSDVEVWSVQQSLPEVPVLWRTIMPFQLLDMVLDKQAGDTKQMKGYTVVQY